MRITVNGEARELPSGATVADAVEAYSPYGNEPVAVVYHGARIDEKARLPLAEGDALLIYPMLIGG